jgi:hypothetical protein|mmetsp:Transcript_39320/g.116504  ORF Transcript_39320/g.116504 Transcript_39320/m.116504 type:complete len:211 (+) Transcript_39320:167-799(+)
MWPLAALHSSPARRSLSHLSTPGGFDGDTSHMPDFFFRCNYCIKLISEDSPVYMRHDHCYCSPACRDKGLSRLYTSLKESQLQDGRLSSGSLATSGNAKSDSSLTSRTTHRTYDELDLHGDSRLVGRLARLGQRVIDVVLQRVASQTWGAQVLRTYSSGMLWGREFTKNSAVGPLFNYLPEVDQYMAKSDSYQSDKTPSSGDLDIPGTST